MADLAVIPTDALARIREFLRRDSQCESACLVLRDWSLVELTNVARSRMDNIVPTGKDYDRFVALLLEDKLFGWAHSHPHWEPRPSGTDLRFHQFPIHMLIYSNCLDKFGLFSPQDLTEIERHPLKSLYVVHKEPAHAQSQHQVCH